MDGDLSVSKVLFLRTRSYIKEAACLVAGGPRGHIHMWNVYHGGSMMAQFQGVSQPRGRYSDLPGAQESGDYFLTKNGRYLDTFTFESIEVDKIVR